MTTEQRRIDERDDQGRPLRSRAGVLGSVVALGLAHARLTITVVGRVPLVMLHSVQTAAKTGFSSGGETRQDPGLMDVSSRTVRQANRLMNHSTQPTTSAAHMQYATEDLSQEFRLKDLTRTLNRDIRPNNTTVRGAASDLMDSVARLHRDYAVVVSNFSEVITRAMENMVSNTDTPVRNQRQSTRFQPAQPVNSKRKKETHND